MNASNLERLLSGATIATVENLGYLLPDETLSAEQAAAPATGAARVRFAGESVGSLHLRLHGNFLPRLTANILGVEETPSESLQFDALGELTHILCSHLLPAVAGVEAVFDVQPPEVGVDPELEPDGCEAAGRCVVAVEDGRLEIELHLTDPATD